MFLFKKFIFLLADDHSVVRLGMSLNIRQLIKEPVFFHSASYKETIEVLKENEVDILILDINFSDGNSTEIIADVRQIRPDIKILIFSAYEEEIYALRYLQAGANGYLNKMSSDDDIKKALTIFFQTGKFISQNMKDKLLDNLIFNKPINLLELLSDREIEIARLLIKGYGNIEISNLMNLKKSTVSTYKKRVYDKLEVDNLVSLIEVFKSFKDKEID